MTTLDSRVAGKLDLIEAVLKGYGMSIAREDALQTLQSLRIDLQKPALHEPVTDAETLAFCDVGGFHHFYATRYKIALEAFLQGRTKPITDQTFWLYELTKGEGIYQGVTGENAESICRQVVKGCPESGEPFVVVLQGQEKSAQKTEPKTFVKRVGDGFKQQPNGTWEKPTQKEITDAEVLAWVDAQVPFIFCPHKKNGEWTIYIDSAGDNGLTGKTFKEAILNCIRASKGKKT